MLQCLRGAGGAGVAVVAVVALERAATKSFRRFICAACYF